MVPVHAKAPEDGRSPKPGGIPDGSWRAESLRRQQLDQRGIFFRPGDEIERPKVMVALLEIQAAVLDDLDQQCRCFLAARTPDDVAAGGSVPGASRSGEPSAKECFPLFIRGDAERLQIPTIFAV